MEQRNGSQAVDRALTILRLFDQHVERLTVSELAKRLGVHRSTASRLAAALERERMLERDPETGAYQLGLGLVSLAGHVLNRFPVRGSGREVIGDLRDRTGETVFLAVVDGDEVIYIDQASSPEVQVNLDWVGRRHPLTTGVTGALLLAFQPADVITELVREARSDHRPSAAVLSEAELDRAKAVGHLARYRDPLSGEAAVAAPVRNHRADIVGAICLGGPQRRIDEQRFDDEIVPLTVQAAAHISERLGFLPS